MHSKGTCPVCGEDCDDPMIVGVHNHDESEDIDSYVDRICRWNPHYIDHVEVYIHKQPSEAGDKP